MNENELLALIYADETDALIRRCGDLSNAGTVDSIATMLLALRDDDDYFDEMMRASSERNVTRGIQA